MLATLGSRRPVVPPVTASLRISMERLPGAWPSARLADVINDLADHGQAVLYLMLWTVTDHGTFWTEHEGLGQSLDFTEPWAHVVEVAREHALIEALVVELRPSLFATIEWIGPGDL